MRQKGRGGWEGWWREGGANQQAEEEGGMPELQGGVRGTPL